MLLGGERIVQNQYFLIKRCPTSAKISKKWQYPIDKGEGVCYSYSLYCGSMRLFPLFIFTSSILPQARTGCQVILKTNQQRIRAYQNVSNTLFRLMPKERL